MHSLSKQSIGLLDRGVHSRYVKASEEDTKAVHTITAIQCDSQVGTDAPKKVAEGVADVDRDHQSEEEKYYVVQSRLQVCKKVQAKAVCNGLETKNGTLHKNPSHQEGRCAVSSTCPFSHEKLLLFNYLPDRLK